MLHGTINLYGICCYYIIAEIQQHAEALQMDKENRNDLWARAMAKKLLL
jgi:hypothetical protein